MRPRWSSGRNPRPVVSSGPEDWPPLAWRRSVRCSAPPELLIGLGDRPGSSTDRRVQSPPAIRSSGKPEPASSAWMQRAFFIGTSVPLPRLLSGTRRCAIAVSARSVSCVVSDPAASPRSRRWNESRLLSEIIGRPAVRHFLKANLHPAYLPQRSFRASTPIVVVTEQPAAAVIVDQTADTPDRSRVINANT